MEKQAMPEQQVQQAVMTVWMVSTAHLVNRQLLVKLGNIVVQQRLALFVHLG